jgi:phosphatidylglycerol:prolipoprotein diacylglycerol transferase
VLLAQSLTFLAFAVGGIVFYLEARRKRLATSGIGKLTLVALVAGLAGAKITELIFGGGQLWMLFDPTTGGRTIIGGVIAGWIAVEIAKLRMGIKRTTGDMFALALPAGEAVGRLGCFVGGCCYGIETSVPWAVFQHGAFRHPTQLYLAIAASLTFAILFLIRKRLPEGALFSLYLMSFGSYRLLIEFFRTREIAFGGLSVAQWVSVEIIASAALLLAYRLRKARLAESVTNG